MNDTARIELVSALALIDDDGRVLLAQRPASKAYGGLWEFPGGKIEAGETPEEGLKREIHEELGLNLDTSCISPLGFASHAHLERHLVLLLYICRKWNGRPTAREEQQLAWVRPQNLSTYPMPPADAPLIPNLRDVL